MTNKSGLADSPFFFQNAGNGAKSPLKGPVGVQVDTPPHDDVASSTDSEEAMEQVNVANKPNPKKRGAIKQSRNRDVITS